jgi:glycerol uptake facilitator-like aquaporin
MFRRKRVAMLAAEFLGTGILTLAVLAVQRSQLSLAYFIALMAGLAVGVLTYVFSNVSGAHMNPALTLALWSARRIKTVPALTYVVVQLLGAWAAYGLYRYFVDTDVTAINQDFDGRILVAEAIGAMVFALGWAAAAYNRWEEGRFAVVAGLTFTLAVLIASIPTTVGLANPALAVGTRAWEVFGENGWGNYLLGPILGTIIGVNLYGLLFADTERSLFGALRGRRSAASSASVVTTSSADDDDEEADEEVVKPARKKSTTKSAATATASKARKTTSTAKKTAVKRTTKK